jgi:hypothetical protein
MFQSTTLYYFYYSLLISSPLKVTKAQFSASNGCFSGNLLVILNEDFSYQRASSLMVGSKSARSFLAAGYFDKTSRRSI